MVPRTMDSICEFMHAVVTLYITHIHFTRMQARLEMYRGVVVSSREDQRPCILVSPVQLQIVNRTGEKT